MDSESTRGSAARTDRALTRRDFLRSVGGAAVGASLLAACGPGMPFGGTPAPARVLRLGHIRPTDNPFHIVAERFAELVGQKTNGAFEIQVFPNSELGGIVDMYSGMQTGTVDMQYGGITAYPFISGAEPFNICAMPFLWKDHDSMQTVLDSEIFAPFFEEAAGNTGIRALPPRGEWETRELSSNVRVQNAADFRGLKIRIAESPMTRRAFEHLGAAPTVIPFADLYVALRTGVADAQENGFSTIRNSSFYEVQRYLVPTHYIREITTFFIAEPLYQEMTADHRRAFDEAAIEAGDEMSTLLRASLQADFEFLAERMEVIEPDLDSIRTALAGAFDRFDGDLWPRGLEAQIREMQGT